MSFISFSLLFHRGKAYIRKKLYSYISYSGSQQDEIQRGYLFNLSVCTDKNDHLIDFYVPGFTLDTAHNRKEKLLAES